MPRKKIIRPKTRLRLGRLLCISGYSAIEAARRVNLSPRRVRQIADDHFWPVNAHIPLGSKVERRIVRAYTHAILTTDELSLVFRQSPRNILRILLRTNTITP